jgi:prepilin-type processing-associated H-X9-DG protein
VGDVSYPSETIVISDPGDPSKPAAYQGFITSPNRSDFLPHHHNGMGNYGFFDGHAKSLKLYDPDNRERWPEFEVNR